MKRLFFGLLALLLALWLHPLVGLGLVTIMALRSLPEHYEIVVIGVIVDVAYHSVIGFGFISLPIYTVLALILFGVTHVIKKRLLFNV